MERLSRGDTDLINVLYAKKRAAEILWKFIRKMQTTISSSVKGRMYNAPFVVYPDAYEIAQTNFWCLYCKFIYHEKIARNMSNQFPRDFLPMIMYFLNLPILKFGKQNRLYICKKDKIIKKFLENDYIISN